MPALKEVGERVFTVIEHTQLLQSLAYLFTYNEGGGLTPTHEGGGAASPGSNNKE